MLFIDNKYASWYNSIITTAKARTLPPNTYTERHHTIPKSLGGSNNENNLVILTAREHFVCHWLLIKMVTGRNKFKMVFALHGLQRKRNYQERYETKITSRVYARIKPIAIEKLAAGRRGTKLGPQSNEHKKKLSLANIGKHDHRGKKNPRFGTTQSSETKELIKISKTKIFKITDPAGQEFLVVGTFVSELKEFCKMQGISARALVEQSKSTVNCISIKSSTYGWKYEVCK